MAIQHDDPLHPGEKVWSYYAHMVSANGADSYIVQDFPPGSVNVPVEAGQLLGYQGRWSRQTQTIVTTWVHLRFSIVQAMEGGSFPDDVVPDNVLDPSPYLGIALKTGKGYNDWQPLRCKEASP